VTLDLIIGVIIAAALVLLLLRWKLARVVFVNSLSHPLQTTVIKIKSDGSDDVETPRSNAATPKSENRKAEQRVVVNN
jgi:hypothetical protein